MKILFGVLLLSICTVLGTVIALYLRVRRQLQASETALRKALDDLEHQRETTKA
jgi:putative exporter of polyketide antibiotics